MQGWTAQSDPGGRRTLVLDPSLDVAHDRTVDAGVLGPSVRTGTGATFRSQDLLPFHANAMAIPAVMRVAGHAIRVTVSDDDRTGYTLPVDPAIRIHTTMLGPRPGP